MFRNSIVKNVRYRRLIKYRYRVPTLLGAEKWSIAYKNLKEMYQCTRKRF